MRPDPRFLPLVLLASAAFAQTRVTVRVNAGASLGAFQPVWNYFGYDEPNYTYTPNGRKLIGELSGLGSVPAHIRTHFFLTSGNGAAAFKFGSTNAYTENASGQPVYDWSTIDRILDTYHEAGATPLVEIGFMPRALSSHPDPYEPHWKPGDKFDRYYLGWTYPPSDYRKWQELIYQWVKHTAERYGKSEVESWDWEVWNEPDIGYWHGSAAEYDKLYDFTAEALKRALPHGKIGGPASTGPANGKAAAFLQQFLEHCSSGRNYATGRSGAPLDFVTFHAKGRPEIISGQLRMGLAQELKDVSEGFDIVHASPRFQSLPVILTEADPEGCAACSAQVYPQNAYRNGTLYPAYTAAAVKEILELSRRKGINLQGALTWAFEFENQPYFAGFRTLATNGIDKPVLNFFRMAGLLAGERLAAESSQSGHGVDVLATRSGRRLSILIWNYRDQNTPTPPVPVRLQISHLPRDPKRLLLKHFRLDENHSNAYTLWRSLGSPQHPNAEQYKRLEQAGHLQLLDSPRWLDTQGGTLSLDFELPLEALSLLELTW